MSVDYRIIARSEAEAVLAEPANYKPSAVLCRVRELFDWIAAQGATVRRYESHYSVGTAGGAGAEVYITENEEGVSAIAFYAYGEFDIPLIGECAARFDGVVFDHQSSEMLTPVEFLRRRRPPAGT